MHERALAAEIVACLASEPGRVHALSDLAAVCRRSVAEVAAACTLLERDGLLDGTVSGGVCLPLHKPQPRLPVVLVVENTPAVAHLVGALLESEGYQVLIAASLAVGARVAAAISLDLVIADSFAATARDALDRLSGLRRAAAPVPVLIFTAHRDTDEPAAQIAGYAGVLPKPFDIDDLLERVAAVVGDRRPPQ